MLFRSTSVGLVAILNQSSLTFGTYLVGSSSPVQTVTLSNSGFGPLNITSIVPPTGYKVTNTCGASVAVGASCTLSVTFIPTVNGVQNGNIVITDNANPTTQNIAVSGTGVTPVIPVLTGKFGLNSVLLTWTASSSVPAQPDTYTVQRTAGVATTAACPTTYANLVTTTTLNYTDTTYANNKKYCYRISAANAGTGSPFVSAPVTVVISGVAGVPGAITYTNVTSTGLTLNWVASTGLAVGGGYEVSSCLSLNGTTNGGNCTWALLESWYFFPSIGYYNQ